MHNDSPALAAFHLPGRLLSRGRSRLRQIVDAPVFQRIIMILIVVNAASLGAETVPVLAGPLGGVLDRIDQIALVIFTVEVSARMFAYGRSFWRDPWNIFDATVVGIALLPNSGALSVLRALRVLRILRLISSVPSMRRVVGALLTAIPGMASVAGLLALILYVAGVMATKLFAHAAPENFGDLGSSLFTLFQIMTGDNWSDVSRDIMRVQPMSWIFFVIYILISTFAVLNLFIAIVVNAMESSASGQIQDDLERLEEREQQTDQLMIDGLTSVRGELAALRTEMRQLHESG